MMLTIDKDYISLIEEGGIFSYSLARGNFILPPNGFSLWNQIRTFLNNSFSKLGIQEVYLPTFIPISSFNKEKNHLEGFSPEFFLVRGYKGSELILRPTSEVLFYEWFSKTLKTYRQLPMLYNQWCQVFRMEKNTKPFLRNTEFLWQEGHTLHHKEKEAIEFIKDIFEIYKEYVENILCISTIVGSKTQGEKFAGAIETYTVECLLPDRQCLQMATVHYFSNNFSKVFKVNFNDNNKLEFPYSTSWGSSTRSIGALVLSHSDNNGLIFPFQISPIQIAIIKHKKNLKIDNYTDLLVKSFIGKYRFKLYEQSSQASINIKNADKEGSALKIIIGNNEVENEELSVSLRINKNKIIVKKSDLFKFIKESELKIANFLKNKSLKNKEENTFFVNSYEKFLSLYNENKQGLFIVQFCNTLKCEIIFKKKFIPFSFRCIINKEINKDKSCMFCNESFSYSSIIARSY
jgi:prolyl-tRNA synthetase